MLSIKMRRFLVTGSATDIQMYFFDPHRIDRRDNSCFLAPRSSNYRSRNTIPQTCIFPAQFIELMLQKAQQADRGKSSAIVLSDNRFHHWPDHNTNFTGVGLPFFPGGSDALKT